jgi:hypothetical protein
MPTEAERTSVTLIPTHSRDTTPHLDSDSAFKVTHLKVNEILEGIKGLIDDILEDAKIVNFNSDSNDIPGLLSPCHCVEVKTKLWIMKVIKLGYNYLCRPTLKQSLELTCSNFWRPLLVEALDAMEKTIQEFRIVRVDGKTIGAAPQPERLARITKLLTSMRKNYQYEILADTMVIPVQPFGERIIILNNGGILMTMKFFQPPSGMK